MIILEFLVYFLIALLSILSVMVILCAFWEAISAFISVIVMAWESIIEIIGNMLSALLENWIIVAAISIAIGLLANRLETKENPKQVSIDKTETKENTKQDFIFKAERGSIVNDSREDVFKSQDTDDSDEESVQAIGVVTGNGVRLRSSMDTTTKANIIDKFSKGTRVEILERNGEWLKVRVNDKVGYMFAEFVDY